MRAIPEDLLREEYYIIAVVSRFLNRHRDYIHALTPLSLLSQIPAKFTKARIVVEHIDDAQRNPNILVPDELKDEEVLLAWLRGCQYNAGFTLELMMRVPLDIRKKPEFVSEAVVSNVFVSPAMAYLIWQVNDPSFPPSEIPFNVIMTWPSGANERHIVYQ